MELRCWSIFVFLLEKEENFEKEEKKSAIRWVHFVVLFLNSLYRLLNKKEVFFFCFWVKKWIPHSLVAVPVNLTPEESEEKWQELASDLSATLQGHAGDIPDSVVPFDAASEIPVDEQKWVNIQTG